MSHDELHLCLAANRVQELGKVLLLACFNDERLGDYPSRSPSTVSHSYSLGSKDRDCNEKRAKQQRSK